MFSKNKKFYYFLSCLSFLICIQCTSQKNEKNSKNVKSLTLRKDSKNPTWSQYMGPNGNGKVDSDFVPNDDFKIIWEFEYEGGTPTPIVIEAGTAFFGTDSSDVYAIDSTGNLKWKIKLDSKVEHSLLVSDSILVATPDSGVVYGINTLDGKIVWKRDLRYEQKNYISDKRDHFGHKIITDTTKYVIKNVGMNEVAPLLDENNVILTLYNHIVSLDIKTGKPDSYFIKNIGSSGIPLITKDAVYVQNGYQNMHAYDKATGDLKWEAKIFDLNEGTKPFVYKDTLYASSYSSLKKINKKTGEAFENYFSSSESEKKYDIIDGHMHYFSEDGYHTHMGINYGANIIAFDLNTDKKLWRYNVEDSKYITELIMVGDYLYFGDSSGNVGTVHKATGEQRSLNYFVGADDITNPLSYANGIIYGTYEKSGNNIIFAIQ